MLILVILYLTEALFISLTLCFFPPFNDSTNYCSKNTMMIFSAFFSYFSHSMEKIFLTLPILSSEDFVLALRRNHNNWGINQYCSSYSSFFFECVTCKIVVLIGRKTKSNISCRKQDAWRLRRGKQRSLTYSPLIMIIITSNSEVKLEIWVIQRFLRDFTLVAANEISVVPLCGKKSIRILKRRYFLALYSTEGNTPRRQRNRFEGKSRVFSCHAFNICNKDWSVFHSILAQKRLCRDRYLDTQSLN